MKAWQCWNKQNDDYSSIVVFAETRNKAKVFCTHLDELDYPEYLDVEIRRMPEADSQYNGRAYIDWYNSADRLFLVKECGWHCDREYVDYDDDCIYCPAQEYCDLYKELTEERNEANDRRKRNVLCGRSTI